MIAITGATGFIGRRLLEQLTRRGYRIRVLVRRGSENKLPQLPLEIVSGSLGESRALEKLVSGCEVVVHCAGLVKALRREDFFQVNVEGTRRLVEVLPRGVRLVYLSSLAARKPELSPYAASKQAGEVVVQAFEGSKIILRPPAVYGPGDRELLPLLEGLRRGILLRLGPKEARFSLLHVDDLTTAVELAIQRREVQGVFELSDGEVYSWPKVAEIARQVFQKKIFCFPVSRGLLFGASCLVAGIGQIFRKPPMLTPAKVRELRYPDWVCENEKIQEKLDFQPEIQLAEGLRQLFITP